MQVTIQLDPDTAKRVNRLASLMAEPTGDMLAALLRDLFTDDQVRESCKAIVAQRAASLQ